MSPRKRNAFSVAFLRRFHVNLVGYACCAFGAKTALTDWNLALFPLPLQNPATQLPCPAHRPRGQPLQGGRQRPRTEISGELGHLRPRRWRFGQNSMSSSGSNEQENYLGLGLPALPAPLPGICPFPFPLHSLRCQEVGFNDACSCLPIRKAPCGTKPKYPAQGCR